MTVTSLGFDPLGTCVSTYASKMNHSCNPNCAVIFSGASLSVRSLQSIRAGGELTQSYVDRTMPTSRRRQSLRSVYYFDCTCDYCKSALTCGLPDPPELLKTRLSLDEVMNLETEGMRLYSISEKASPLEKTGLLGKAMGLFYAIKDMYPLWRYPWPTIRHAVTLAQMTLEHWYEALGHALKGYFYIEPVLYPTTWDPLRTMRTFLLVKIMVEIEYNKSQSQDAGSALGNLDRYQINWPVAISGLMAEVQAAIPKGFGTDSGFAREFEQLRRGVGLEDGGWISLWGREREKLKKPAREMVD
ncbi:MAG: hypothetical protein LQ343_000033 [Gyalolechia ehrenbergii]|nr:MAG: hypothetical protein LQ343_000033 [Gyalolechia ehrenbergii]